MRWPSQLRRRLCIVMLHSSVLCFCVQFNVGDFSRSSRRHNFPYKLKLHNLQTVLNVDATMVHSFRKRYLPFPIIDVSPTLVMHSKEVRWRHCSLLFVFTISLLSNYRVKWYDYTVLVYDRNETPLRKLSRVMPRLVHSNRLQGIHLGNYMATLCRPK